MLSGCDICPLRRIQALYQQYTTVGLCSIVSFVFNRSDKLPISRQTPTSACTASRGCTQIKAGWMHTCCAASSALAAELARDQLNSAHVAAARSVVEPRARAGKTGNMRRRKSRLRTSFRLFGPGLLGALMFSPIKTAISEGLWSCVEV